MLLVELTNLGRQVANQFRPIVHQHQKVWLSVLNAHHFGGGRPRKPERTCADAIFFVLRTGCQWGALDETGICPHSTAHDRFLEWVEAGVFEKLWQAGVEQFDQLKGIDWEWISMDGSMGKAPLGGEKMRAKPNR